MLGLYVVLSSIPVFFGSRYITQNFPASVDNLDVGSSTARVAFSSFQQQRAANKNYAKEKHYLSVCFSYLFLFFNFDLQTCHFNAL